MARIADVLIALALLAGTLIFDPVSADPLAPKVPLALLCGAPCVLASVLAAPGLALGFADLCVMAGFALLCSLACLSPSPLASGPVVATGLLVCGAWLTGRASGARERALTTTLRVTLAVLALSTIATIGAFERPTGLRLDEGAPTRTLVGPLTNPDYLAGWLVVTLPVVALGRYGKVSLLLGLSLLAGTLSRGAWIALAASAGIFFGLAARSGATRLFALAAVAVVLMGMALPSPEDRAKLTRGTTLAKRVELWTRTATLIPERPWTGHGPGRFPQLADRSRPADWEERGLSAVAGHAHALPLEIGVEYGLAGLAVGALLIAWFGSRFARAPEDPATRALACGLTAFLLHNLVSMTAYVLPVLLLAALAAGALATRVSPPAEWTRHGRAHALILACVLALAHVAVAPWALSQNRALHEAGLASRALTREDVASARTHALAAAREATSDPRVRYTVAAALAANGHAYAALAQSLLLGATDPYHGQQGFNRAVLQLALDRPKAALAELERFLSREPKFAPALELQRRARESSSRR